MAQKHLYKVMAALLPWILLAGCNASSPGPDEGDYGNTAITSFSLVANNDVLANLDSVFFSIDLVDGRIYNADSLPAGTDVSHLVVKIGTPSVNECRITYLLPGTVRDTTISHIGSPNDSINFTGPVTVEVVSLNKQYSRVYRLDVNVHEQHPDSLVWNGDGEKPMRLPSELTGIENSKTIDMAGKAVCLTADHGNACLAVSNDISTGIWEKRLVTLPQNADIESFNSLGTNLYILAGGKLYESGDMGQTWNATDCAMEYVYGSNGNMLAGVEKDGQGNFWHVTYPTTTRQPVPDGCPVKDAGDFVTLQSIWTTQPVSLILGGVTVGGEKSGECWGFDGKSWARISHGAVNAVSGVSLIPYFTFKMDYSIWRATKESILLAFGGRDNEGNCRREVSISYDCGIHWQPADSLLNLPDFIPAFSGAQALIFDKTIHSRVEKPVTEWTCPYIYLFGGRDQDGKALPMMWRGLVSRLSYKPLY